MSVNMKMAESLPSNSFVRDTVLIKGKELSEYC